MKKYTKSCDLIPTITPRTGATQPQKYYYNNIKNHSVPSTPLWQFNWKLLWHFPMLQKNNNKIIEKIKNCLIQSFYLFALPCVLYFLFFKSVTRLECKLQTLLYIYMLLLYFGFIHTHIRLCWLCLSSQRSFVPKKIYTIFLYRKIYKN